MRMIETYWPKEIANIKEFKEIARIENKYIGKVNEKLEELFLGQFIRDAPLNAIKRYEKIMSIAPDSSKTLEERRQTIINKWNRKLPYTVRSLECLVSDTVGKENVKIKIQEYNLDLILLNQSTDLIIEIRKTVEGMIPANMVFLMIAEYIIESLVEIDIETVITINSNFYPRDNVEYLYFDGTVEQDGTYVMNGYKTDQHIDFYPIRLTISSCFKEKIEQKIGITYEFSAMEKIITNARCEIGMNFEVRKKYSTTISMLFSTLHKMNSCSKSLCMKGYSVEEKIQLNYLNKIKTEVIVKEKCNKVVTVLCFASQEIRTDVRSIAAKDIWYLDGSVILDGSRMITEKINIIDMTQ